MKLKLSLYILSLLILLSCGKDSVINNLNTDKWNSFPIDTGYFWNYKSAEGKEIRLNVVLYDSAKWYFNYWDTSKVTNLKSYIIEAKFIENGFPNYQNFAVAKIDGGFLFGMQGFKFTYNDELPYFVKMFLIPDSISEQIQYHYLSLGSFYYADSTSMSYNNNSLINDKLYDFWIINNFFIFDYKQRKFNLNNFIFADKFGFFKFMNCDLIDFKIKN